MKIEKCGNGSVSITCKSNLGGAVLGSVLSLASAAGVGLAVWSAVTYFGFLTKNLDFTFAAIRGIGKKGGNANA